MHSSSGISVKTVQLSTVAFVFGGNENSIFSNKLWPQQRLTEPFLAAFQNKMALFSCILWDGSVFHTQLLHLKGRTLLQMENIP